MTCSSCGAEYEGKFCPQCGAAAPEGTADAGGSAAPAGSPVPEGDAPESTPPPGGPAAQPAAEGGITDNVAGTLCYVLGFVTGIIFLVLEPYNRNKTIRFHAFQSIFLSVAVFVINVAVTILAMLTAGILGLLMPLIALGIFVLWVVLLLKTYQGQKIVLPIIGPMAEKQA